MRNEVKDYWKINGVNEYLDSTLDEFINSASKFIGETCNIKGRLKNVEEEIKNSKYPNIYSLIVEDTTGAIEVEIKKSLLNGYRNGHYVELTGQPKFNFYKGSCIRRFRAFHLQPCSDDVDIHNMKSELSFADKLKKFRPKAISFPQKVNLKVGLIYSAASTVNIQNDFFENLKDYKNCFECIEFPISLSNEDALVQAINYAKDLDVIVIVRGGGSTDVFKIFNNERVLEAFNDVNTYRIVGLGHNTDITILDYLAEHSSITPTNAGLHLKNKIVEGLDRNKKILKIQDDHMQIEQKLRKKYAEINQLKNEIAKLPEKSEFENLRDKHAELKAKLQLEQAQPKEGQNKNIQFLALLALVIGIVIGKLIL